MSNLNNFNGNGNGDDYGAYRPNKNEEIVEDAVVNETIGKDGEPRSEFVETYKKVFGNDPTSNDYNQNTTNYNQQGAYNQQENYTQQPVNNSYTQQPVNNSYTGKNPYYNQQADYTQQPVNNSYTQQPVNNSGYGNWSPKSKLAAGLFGIFLGLLGVHNFYLGFTGKAVAQLLITVLSLGILSFVSATWGLIEGILILASATGTKWDLDANGYPMPPIGNQN